MSHNHLAAQTIANETFLQMANATYRGMVSALNEAESCIDDGDFEEANRQLRLYAVLEASVEQSMNRLFPAIPALPEKKKTTATADDRVLH